MLSDESLEEHLVYKTCPEVQLTREVAEEYYKK